MNKILAIILSVILILSLVGCGSIISFKGAPEQEIVNNMVNEVYSDAIFKEIVESEDGELHTFYYEATYEIKDHPVTKILRTYSVESYYNNEYKQWEYSPIKEVGKYHEWDIKGTWYPVIGQYTNTTTYKSNYVMKIGEIEDNRVHITFTKDGKVCFNETIDFHNVDGASFEIKSGDYWHDFRVYITADYVWAEDHGGDECLFERA